MLLAAAVLPIVVVFLALERLLVAGVRHTESNWLRWGLSFGLGTGLSGLTIYGWMHLAGGVSPAACGLDAAFWLCSLAVLWEWRRVDSGFRSRFASIALAGERQPEWASHGLRITQWGVGAAAMLAVAGCLLAFQSEPLGDWDAWSIWNLRALQIARSGDGWTSVFLPEYDHADYPLLVPCAVARLWAFSGNVDPLAPWLVGMLNLAGIVLVVAGTVRFLCGAWQAGLAALSLLGSVTLLRFAAAQYADVPLAFCVTATLSLWLVAADPAPCQSRTVLLAISGLTAGLAAWTKNEGLLFLAVSAAVLVGTALLRREMAARWAPFVIAAVPLLAIVVDFKLRLAPGNDLIAGQGPAETLARLTDWSRYALIARGFLGGAFQVTHLLCLALPLSALCLGAARIDLERRRNMRQVGLVLGLVLLGYAGVYLVTPLDLPWHLNTSVTRLCLHLAPTALVLLFAALRTPDDWAREARQPAFQPVRELRRAA